MNQIAALRDTLGNVYRRHDYWLLPLFRALTAFVLFMVLRTRLGYSDLFAGVPVILAASLFCAFLPWAGIPFLGAVLVLGNLYSASLELTLVGTLVLLMAALVQSAFRAKGAVILALLPFFYLLHIPYAVVLAAGFSLGILGFIPLALGGLLFPPLCGGKCRRSQQNDRHDGAGQPVCRYFQRLSRQPGNAFDDCCGITGLPYGIYHSQPAR